MYKKKPNTNRSINTSFLPVVFADLLLKSTFFTVYNRFAYPFGILRFTNCKAYRISILHKQRYTKNLFLISLGVMSH